MVNESDQPKSGWGAGCVIAAVLGLVLIVVVVLMAPRVYSYLARQSPPPATGAQPPPPAVQPQLMSTPGKPAIVKLTALGEGGTWYMIDEDICEGDAALTAMLQDRIARDKAARGNPAGYSYPVRFEVAAGAGIGDAHVAAARKAAEAAGATVMPSEPSKEAAK